MPALPSPSWTLMNVKLSFTSKVASLSPTLRTAGGGGQNPVQPRSPSFPLTEFYKTSPGSRTDPAGSLRRGCAAFCSCLSAAAPQQERQDGFGREEQSPTGSGLSPTSSLTVPARVHQEKARVHGGGVHGGGGWGGGGGGGGGTALGQAAVSRCQRK